MCIVTDPHDGASVGLPAPATMADIVLESHGHHDHLTGEQLVSKGWAKTKVLRSFRGEKKIKGIAIKGIRTFHDEFYGAKRGENTVYTFTVDGITFCHLGDLGHVLTDEQAVEMGSVNILFVPVGGTYTIDSAGASKVVEKIKPNIAIGMHYKVHGLTMPIASVDDFIRGKKDVKVLESSKFEIKKNQLPAPTRIIVFRPPTG